MELMTKEKKGFKSTDVGLIPEDWKLVKLEDISELLGGYAFKSSNFKTNGKFQVVKMSNVYMNDLNLNRSQSYLDTIESGQTDYLLNSGDIIISLTGTVGKEDYGFSYRLRDETNLLLNQRLAKISAKPDISNVFLDFQLKTRAFLKQFFELGKGGTGNQTNVSIKNLAELHIPLPPTLAEQQAVASALSDVDKLIRYLDGLIQKKQTIKKGTMQQFLSGKKRLPGFDGEWEVKKLGDLGQAVIGLTYNKDDVQSHGTLVLRSSNIQDDRLAYDDNVFVSSNVKSEKYVQEGDVLICARNGSRRLIGKCAYIDKKAEGAAFGAFMAVLRSDFGKFIFYAFQSDLIQQQINEHLGATINQITNKSLRSFEIPFPNSDKERIAIVEVLDDMDQELQTLRQKREKYVQIKQGMMQELLTGKVRLV